MHGESDGKHNNVPEPGVNFGPATKAPAADPSNADQPVVKIASSEDDSSSKIGSEGSSDTLSPSDSSSALSSSDRKSNPWHRPAVDSPLQLPSLIHGEGTANRGVKWFVWRGWYS